MNILAIDDARAVHAFLDRSLKDSPYQLTHCYTAKEGYELLVSASIKFKAVLLDWEMPEMDGPTLLKKLREAGVQIPILMVTSKNKPNEISEMLAAGATEYIMKPFSPDILIAKLDTLLGEAA